MDSPPSDEIVIRSMNDVEDLLKRARNLQEAIDQANLEAAYKKEAVEDERRQFVEPLQERRDEIMKAIGAHATPRRRWWLRRYGTTVKLPGAGAIAWRVVPRSLEAPANDKDLVKQLLEIRGGKRYLITSHKPDRRALAAANSKFLRRLGLWAGRHERLIIATEGQALKDGYVYSVRRYPWNNKRKASKSRKR